MVSMRSAFRRKATDDASTSVAINTVEDSKTAADKSTSEKNASSDDAAIAAAAAERDTEASKSEDQDTVDEGAQAGVRDVEAVTLTWSKKTLIFVFFNIWMLYFVNAFQSSIVYNLIPYATSDFSAHSLLNVIFIVANAMTAACYIPLAKILDVFGRAEGFLCMTVFATLGMILMASSHNLPTFCAAYTFYNLGFGGMTYCVDVITADASKLKNRGLAYAFTSSPYMIVTFAASKASERFYNEVSWRWGIGCFAIVFPVVAAPLFFVLKWNVRKATKHGILETEKVKRTFLQSVWYYLVEFDALGVFLFSVGLLVFFLPFDIASSAPNGWGTGYIIAMIILGLVMLVVFVLYEKFLAPVPMLNFGLITDRTVIGACLLDATYQISYYCWANYFTSFLQAVNNVSIAEAGYISHTFDVVSGILLIIVGILISKTGRFKWLLYVAVPLYIFSQGLMIYFRRPNQSVGYLIMCQVFISIGGSIFIIIEQISILAAVDHRHVAAALALLNVVGTVGGGAGVTISGAIWTNTFYKYLERNLPASAMPDVATIYEDIATQLSYPVGSPTRLVIQEAYGYAQTRMLAAGTGIMGLSLIWILLIRNIDLKKVPQVKGMVF